MSRHGQVHAGDQLHAAREGSGDDHAPDLPEMSDGDPR
jgi:hypothetical protein